MLELTNEQFNALAALGIKISNIHDFLYLATKSEKIKLRELINKKKYQAAVKLLMSVLNN